MDTIVHYNVTVQLRTHKTPVSPVISSLEIVGVIKHGQGRDVTLMLTSVQKEQTTAASAKILFVKISREALPAYAKRDML